MAARVVAPVFACALAVPPLALAQLTYTTVSVNQSGTPGNGHSYQSSLSADGTVVAFVSEATDLVAADTNGVADVFVRDRTIGSTTRVSVATGGTEANGASTGPRVSGDGRFVVFVSTASNLAAGDSNGVADVFVHDRQMATTTRVSVSTSGVEADDFSEAPVVSHDGRYVVFASWATNLVAGDGNTFCTDRYPGQRTDNCEDVFVHDRQSAMTRRISVATSGAEANGRSGGPAIGASGGVTWVAFASEASNLVAGDTNGRWDVFVRDLPSGITTRENVTTAGAQLDGSRGGPNAPVLSADGRWLVFSTVPPPDWPAAGPGVSVNAVRDRLTGITSRTVPLDQTPFPPFQLTHYTAIANGGRLATADYRFPMYPESRLIDRLLGSIVGLGGQCSGRPTVAANGWTVAVDVFGCPAVNPGISQVDVADLDRDADGMFDPFESAFGLNPSDPADANLDPDNDGLTNVQEFVAGSHPRGTHTRLLAEGVTGGAFDTRLDLFTPGTQAGTAIVQFERTDGTRVHNAFSIGAQQAGGFSVKQTVPGLERAEFSTLIESDQELVATRTVDWGADRQAESAVAAPSTTWHFAEGATHSGFQLFYLVQNPLDVPSTVTATWMRPAPEPLRTSTYIVGPHARRTVWVNYDESSLGATDVAASFDASSPVVVERVMYVQQADGTFGAGHGAVGVTAPATSWTFAEGATGALFDLFLLIANPGASEAAITVDYLLSGGTTVSRSHAVAARARRTIWVDLEDARLANTALSMRVTSTNGVPVLAERAMWWPGPTPATWLATHATAGATAPGTVWALAGLREELAPGTGIGAGILPFAPAATASYILIANTSPYPARVKVTLFLGGAPSEHTYAVAASSRLTIRVAEHDPFLRVYSGGALVESVGTPPADIVVEQATYVDVAGVPMRAGTNTLATRLR